MEIGHKTWAIADGHIPGWGTGDAPQLQSHESLSFLNATETDANVELTILYADREPAGPYRLTVPAMRTYHQQTNKLTDPEPVPVDTDYSVVVRSDVPIVVQHTRLDSRQAENALLTTIAYATGD
jgi:hypothetical protein